MGGRLSVPENSTTVFRTGAESMGAENMKADSTEANITEADSTGSKKTSAIKSHSKSNYTGHLNVIHATFGSFTYPSVIYVSRTKSILY